MRLFSSVTLGDIEKRGLATQIWRQSYHELLARGALTPTEGELFKAALRDSRAIDGGMNWYRANIPDFDRISDADYPCVYMRHASFAGSDAKADEVFLRLEGQDEEFTVALRRYAGARELARESTADRRPIYEQKARAAQQTMVSWLRSKLPTAMSVTYRGQS